MLAFVRTLPDHSLLDRLVRGRAWIPVLGVMLAGIVFMQVEELKLGATFGRAMQQTAQLSAQNEALLASTGALGDTGRIESLAARMGYIMPAPSQTGFLDGTGDPLTAAMANTRAPNPNLYLNSTSSNGGIAGTPVASQAYTLGGATGSSSSSAAATGTSGTAAGTSGTATGTSGTAAGTTGTAAGTTGTATGTSGTATATNGGTATTGSTGTAATTPAGTPTTAQGQAAPPAQTTGTTGGAALGAPQGNATTGG